MDLPEDVLYSSDIHRNIGNAVVVSESLRRIFPMRIVNSCSHILHDPLLLGMLLLWRGVMYGEL